MSDVTVPEQKTAKTWYGVAGIGSLGAIGAAFVSNLDKITPFLREFGMAAFAIIAGGMMVGVITYWFLSVVTSLGKEAIGSHKEFLTSQTETSRKQNEILEGISKTQAVHGERLDHHTTILEDLRRDRGRPCNVTNAVSSSPGSN